MTITAQNTKVSKKVSRDKIVAFEKEIKSQEGSFIGDSENCPLKHSFTDGIYVREIFIPAGMFIVGKIHLHEHPNFLLKGTVKVVTEEGEKTLKGPLSMISPAGTKRALYSVTDVVWATIHHNPTNTQDIKELEKIVIADSYDDYEKKKLKSGNKFITRWNKILNNLIIK